MDAFAAMDDDLFGPTTTTTVRKPHHQEQQQQQQQQHQQQQQQEHFLRKMDSSPSIDLIDNEVEASAFSDAHHQLLTRYTGIQAEAEQDVILSEQQKQQHQQQQQMDSSPRLNNSSSNMNNSNNVSADPSDSKEACKDAGSWSTQATSVLLDVFREKRIAVNGRNFRGEEWDELAIGVNEKCHQHLMANGSSGSSYSSPSAAAAAAAAKDQWKTAKQCSYKMSNLKRKYKSEKEMLQLSGPNSVSAWQWFLKMDAIFSSDPKYAVLGSGTQQTRIENATASVVAAAADFFDDELMLNNMNKNNSKSTSATNNSPSPSRQQQNEMANSPRCMSELHVRKKQCINNNNNTNNNVYGNSSSPGGSDFVMPVSFADSMKLMLVQQKETIQLLRELVSIKQHNRGQEQDNPELLESTRDLRLKIETVDRELMQLKLIYEAKEREFKDAMLAYEEKCRVKDDLVRKLTEAALCKERRRNRMPEANSESM